MTAPRRPDPAPDPEIRNGVWAGFLEAQPRIRVAARGIFPRPDDDAILVVRDHDPARGITFYFPPGGGMRFGERAEETLQREMHEELRCGVRAPRLVHVMENHFTHRGVSSHEIVFIFTGELTDPGIYRRDTFELDDGGGRFAAAWMSVGEFRTPARPGLPPLYPDDLLDVIQSGLP